MKNLKQLFCTHVWTEDYITYRTLWPYTMSRQRVWRCTKCGKVVKKI